MTMQSPGQFALPEPKYPLTTRVVTDRIFPLKEPQQMKASAECQSCKQHSEMLISVPVPEEKETPLVWTISQPHPLIPTMKVARIFLIPEDRIIVIYSLSNDGTAPLRNTIPMSAMRFSEETMPLDLFKELIEAEESDDEEEEELDDPEEPETPGAPHLAAVPTTSA